MENSKKRRESIPLSPREELKVGRLAAIREMTDIAKAGGFNSNLYVLPEDSKESNLNAIFEHKIKYNVNDPYAVIDKKNKTLNIYKKDLLIKSYPITTGLNKGDGMAPLSAKYLSQTPRTTGAGIFTILSKETSPYMGNEPLFRLIPDSVETIVLAIHSPSGPSRIQAIKNKVGSTYGCVNGFCGTAKEIYENKLLNDKDSVYVLPEVKGNNIVEKNGKLSMSWGNNNPKTYRDSKGKIQYFRYNNKK